MQVQAQNLPKEIDVSFKSKCADDFVSETSVCKNIPYGESVDFTASIILDRCMNKSLQFEISPIGIGQVRLQNKYSPIVDLSNYRIGSKLLPSEQTVRTVNNVT